MQTLGLVLFAIAVVGGFLRYSLHILAHDGMPYSYGVRVRRAVPAGRAVGVLALAVGYVASLGTFCW